MKYYLNNLIELAGDDLELVAYEFVMKVKGIEKFVYPVKVSGVSELALKSSQAKISLFLTNLFP